MTARYGDSRRYPWGDADWDEERANIEGYIGHPTSIGVYPKGVTPAGLYDASGNVWEWTLSLYQDYPYLPDNLRNDPTAEGYRGVRGGSWLDALGGARCAFRNRLLPVNFTFDLDLGFRVVVSLADSAF